MPSFGSLQRSCGAVMFLQLAPILLSFLFSAHSAEVYLNTQRIDYTRPSAATQLELIKCFTTGECKQDDKIRIYPMACEGSGNADCTGCYHLQGGNPVRVGDLGTDGTCKGVGKANDQMLRVFVGYERSCPAGTAVGDPCFDGQLLLSCSVTSEGGAGAGGSSLTYNQDCFSGRPYVRRGGAGATLSTALPSFIPMGPAFCDVGSSGTYPNCVPCSDTSYKFTTGDGACTECAAPVIANASSQTYSTAGTSKTSANDCKVVNYYCASGYLKNTLQQTCDAPPAPSPTPSVISSSEIPSPSPTPTPSSDPSSLDCGGAKLAFYLLYVQPTTVINGVDQDRGAIDHMVVWDPTLFAPGDYLMETLETVKSGQRKWAAGGGYPLAGEKKFAAWYMFNRSAGDYVSTIWATRFGVVCGKTERFLTIPVLPPTPGPSPLPLP